MSPRQRKGFFYLLAAWLVLLPIAAKASLPPLSPICFLGQEKPCNGAFCTAPSPDGRLGKGFAKGAALGDYAQYKNTAQAIGGFAGQMAVNFTPAGWAGDVRDFSAAAGQVNNQGLGWRTGAGVALSAVAFVPVVGDALKGVAKPLLKAADDVPINSITHAAAKSPVIPKQTTVIGSRADTLVAKGWPGHNVLDVPTWSAKGNVKWLDSAIRHGDDIYLATDPAKHAAILNSLPTRPYSAFLDLELPYLQWRGYVQEGVRMVPKSP